MEAPDRPEQKVSHARTASLNARWGREDIELSNQAEVFYWAGSGAPLEVRPNLRIQGAQRKLATR